MTRLRLGSCPDSWGVWFADDPRQTPWERFLDELAGVGYEWLELGPYGYLPTDPARLADELARRGLRVAGGTMHGWSGLHRPGEFAEILARTRLVAALTAAVGARDLVFVPVPGYRDDVTGAYLEPGALDDDGWRTLLRSTNDLGRALAEEYGVRLQFHHHADSYVETRPQIDRLLDGTDPAFVSLCLDTGHLAYGGGDAATLIADRPDRVGYVHIKQMDPAVVARARADDLAFGQAVALGASCEPPAGEPDLPTVVKALRDRGADTFVIVEQDMYPVDFDKPAPIAARTRAYLTKEGIA
ncbi:TIM barrel protein [Spirilliplanes yamanashiensis]|uniref:IolE protein n=1 Tax=Spirilliplanes yamanashiensis TaxID=42233 RepID=A0A8J3Y9C0_9ACTN|nr:TIM barrel protein [Spirilliplanes yamanashiensis]MDP9817586.1 inosose dehydratase [Spirilliplanes yamanashiensis]GIJ04396.1 IolE protein [Spirilliplanes yamanashiensis]